MADGSGNPKKKQSSNSKKPSKQKGRKEQVHLNEDGEQQKNLRRKEELELRFRRQAECEAKAHVVTLRLITETVTEEFLKDAGQFISPSHYKDVNEERGISRICGYPICDNEIKSVPKQKYRISLQTNQVFDITERKYFCRDTCYKASKYYEKQISTTPVWARAEEEPVQFQLLSAKTKSMIPSSGEVVFTDPRKLLQAEMRELDRLDELELGRKPADVKKPKEEPEIEDKENAEDAEREAESDSLAEDLKRLLKLDEPPLNAAEKEVHVVASGGDDDAGAVEVMMTDLAKQVSDLLLVNEDVDGDEHAGATSQEKDEHYLNQTSSSMNDFHLENDSQKEVPSLGNHSQANLELSHSQANSQAADSIISQLSDSCEIGQNDDNETAANADEGFQEPDSGDSSLSTAEELQKKNKYMYCNIEARMATGVTDDKINLLMSLIDKRERMKNQIQVSHSTRPAKDHEGTSKQANVLANNSNFQSAVNRGEPSISKTGQREERTHLEPGTQTEEWNLKKKLESVNTERESGSTSAIEADVQEESSLKDAREMLQKIDLDGKIDIVTATGTGKAAAPIKSQNHLPAAQFSADDDASHDHLSQTNSDCLSCEHQVSTERTVGHDEHQSSCSLDCQSHLKQERGPEKDVCITDYAAVIKSPESDHAPSVKPVKVSKRDVLANIQRLDSKGSKHKTGKKTKAKSKPAKSDAVVSPLEAVQRILAAWWTEGTFEHLHGVGSASGMTKAEFAERYAELGRRVDKLADIDDILQDDGDGAEVKNKITLRAPPDMSRVIEDTEKFDLKVREYYKGHMTYPTMSEEELMAEGLAAMKELKKSRGEHIEEEEPPEPILPLVDSHQQMAHRRKIVLDKLSFVLPSLLQPMHLRVSDVSSELRTLVHTFNLQSSNLYLRPAEWTLMGYLLLHFLYQRLPILHQAFVEHSAVQYFQSMIASLGVSDSDIENLIKTMTLKQ